MRRIAGSAGSVDSLGRLEHALTQWLPARRVAWLILVLVVGAYGALAIVGVVFSTADPGQALLSAVFVLALLTLQLGYLSRPSPRRGVSATCLALAAQAALVFLPIFLFGPVWHGFPGFLAGSALLLLPAAFGVPAFVLVIAAITVVSAAEVPFAGLLDAVTAQLYVISSATTSGLAVFGLSLLVRLVDEAHEAREELRRVAVARERARLAEDVQAVLGQSLSAISLRGELIARLIDRSPERARAVLAEVLGLARKALAEVRALVGLRRDLEESGRDVLGPDAERYVAPRIGRAMLAAVLVSLSVVAVVGMAYERGPVVATIFGLLRVALVVAQVAATRLENAGIRTRVGLLVVIAVLAYGPQPFLGPISHASDVFVAGSALLLLRAVPGVALATLVCAASVVIEYLDPAPAPSLAYSLSYALVGSVLLTLVIYGLGTVPRLVTQLDDARDEIAETAAVAERVRVARDVHDLLGLGLSTITLKCDLADKLLERAPDRARSEVADVLVAARQALADVRSAVGGGSRLSLDEEWRAVVAALESAAVEVRESRIGTTPDDPGATVLATVLREGVTNVLRHSSAQWCDISIHRSPVTAVLEIVNDGVNGLGGLVDGEERSGGNGLRNMAERVRSLGGDLDATREGDVYRLRARVPVVA